jgi:hypothetical protein
MRFVLRFLNPRNVRLAEIRWQIIEACGECAINGGNVREWCLVFRAGSTNVHDGGRSGSSKSSSAKFPRVLHSPDLAASHYHFVSPTQIFGLAESEGKPKDKRRIAGLAERLDHKGGGGQCHCNIFHT